MYQMDTIAAISTALGEGAIGIVRMSGEEAIEIANRVYKGKDLTKVPTHTIHYGHIIDPRTNEVLDEVMVTVMKGPKSFTIEDIIEINTHGGIIAVQSVLEALLQAGARLAEPGEFTQRAFLNGRIDLSQAEAIMDLIQAKSKKAMTASMSQLQGGLSKPIRELRQEMLQTLATVEVTIDYPEYDDVEELSMTQLKETAISVKEKIQLILDKAQRGKIFRQGINTAIIGRPNVGKSSLLNYLVGEEKAIVTEIAGTTRDTVEEFVSVRGIPLHLVDTAGIRQTDDVVEAIGIERSKQAMDQADLIILLINQAEEFSQEDQQLLEITHGRNRIIILNKQDLPTKVRTEDLAPWVEAKDIVTASVMTQEGLDDLESQIEERFFKGQLESADINYLLNTRHTQLLQEAMDSLDEVIEATEMMIPVDLIQIDFTHAWNVLGEIIGESVQDELLTKLFSEFCLGK